MDDAKSISTPMGTNGSLDSNTSGNMVDQKLYRSMIGSLLYVTASRPDVMFSVCMRARFQASPRESHLKAIKRILRYLKHTQNVGINRGPTTHVIIKVTILTTIIIIFHL